MVLFGCIETHWKQTSQTGDQPYSDTSHNRRPAVQWYFPQQETSRTVILPTTGDQPYSDTSHNRRPSVQWYFPQRWLSSVELYLKSLNGADVMLTPRSQRRSRVQSFLATRYGEFVSKSEATMTKKNEELGQRRLHPNQCDQIGRNFVTLAKFSK